MITSDGENVVNLPTLKRYEQTDALTGLMFNASDFIKKNYQCATYHDLQNTIVPQLSDRVKTEQDKMMSLVHENLETFIRCKDSLDQIHSGDRELFSGTAMDEVAESFRDVRLSCLEMLEPLFENSEEIQRWRELEEIAKRVENVTEVPAMLTKHADSIDQSCRLGVGSDDPGCLLHQLNGDTETDISSFRAGKGVVGNNRTMRSSGSSSFGNEKVAAIGRSIDNAVRALNTAMMFVTSQFQHYRQSSPGDPSMPAVKLREEPFSENRKQSEEDGENENAEEAQNSEEEEEEDEQEQSISSASQDGAKISSSFLKLLMIALYSAGNYFLNSLFRHIQSSGNVATGGTSGGRVSSILIEQWLSLMLDVTDKMLRLEDYLCRIDQQVNNNNDEHRNELSAMMMGADGDDNESRSSVSHSVAASSSIAATTVTHGSGGIGVGAFALPVTVIAKTDEIIGHPVVQYLQKMENDFWEENMLPLIVVAVQEATKRTPALQQSLWQQQFSHSASSQPVGSKVDNNQQNTEEDAQEEAALLAPQFSDLLQIKDSFTGQLSFTQYVLPSTGKKKASKEREDQEKSNKGEDEFLMLPSVFSLNFNWGSGSNDESTLSSSSLNLKYTEKEAIQKAAAAQGAKGDQWLQLFREANQIQKKTEGSISSSANSSRHHEELFSLFPTDFTIASLSMEPLVTCSTLTAVLSTHVNTVSFGSSSPERASGSEASLAFLVFQKLCLELTRCIAMHWVGLHAAIVSGKFEKVDVTKTDKGENRRLPTTLDGQRRQREEQARRQREMNNRAFLQGWNEIKYTRSFTTSVGGTSSTAATSLVMQSRTMMVSLIRNSIPLLLGLFKAVISSDIHHGFLIKAEEMRKVRAERYRQQNRNSAAARCGQSLGGMKNNDLSAGKRKGQNRYDGVDGPDDLDNLPELGMCFESAISHWQLFMDCASFCINELCNVVLVNESVSSSGGEKGKATDKESGSNHYIASALWELQAGLCDAFYRGVNVLGQFYLREVTCPAQIPNQLYPRLAGGAVSTGNLVKLYNLAIYLLDRCHESMIEIFHPETNALFELIPNTSILLKSGENIQTLVSSLALTFIDLMRHLAFQQEVGGTSIAKTEGGENEGDEEDQTCQWVDNDTSAATTNTSDHRMACLLGCLADVMVCGDAFLRLVIEHGMEPLIWSSIQDILSIASQKGLFSSSSSSRQQQNSAASEFSTVEALRENFVKIVCTEIQEVLTLSAGMVVRCIVSEISSKLLSPQVLWQGFLRSGVDWQNICHSPVQIRFYLIQALEIVVQMDSKLSALTSGLTGSGEVSKSSLETSSQKISGASDEFLFFFIARREIIANLLCHIASSFLDCVHRYLDGWDGSVSFEIWGTIILETESEFLVAVLEDSCNATKHLTTGVVKRLKSFADQMSKIGAVATTVGNSSLSALDTDRRKMKLKLLSEMRECTKYIMEALSARIIPSSSSSSGHIDSKAAAALKLSQTSVDAAKVIAKKETEREQLAAKRAKERERERERLAAAKAMESIVSAEENKKNLGRKEKEKKMLHSSVASLSKQRKYEEVVDNSSASTKLKKGIKGIVELQKEKRRGEEQAIMRKGDAVPIKSEKKEETHAATSQFSKMASSTANTTERKRFSRSTAPVAQSTPAEEKKSEPKTVTKPSGPRFTRTKR